MKAWEFFDASYAVTRPVQRSPAAMRMIRTGSVRGSNMARAIQRFPSIDCL